MKKTGPVSRADPFSAQRSIGGEGEDHEVECPHCHKTVIIDEGTGIYECADCGKDIEISLVCPKCGEKREVEKWGEEKCRFCGTSFDSWDESEVAPIRTTMTPWEAFKGFLTILGAITFVLLVLSVIGWGYVSLMSDQLAPSSKAYTEESIRAIVTTWSEDELIKRASPEMQATTTHGQLDQLFIALKKLGKFQSYDGAKTEQMHFSLNHGLIVTITYNAAVTFQLGKANIMITLVRHHNAWQIIGFHVNPYLL